MLLNNFVFLEYIVLRLNVLNFLQNQNKIKVLTDGFKITTAQEHNFYNCVATEDIQQYQACIVKVQLDLIADQDKLVINLKLLDKIAIYWCTNIHLKVLTFLREVEDFVFSFLEAMNWESSNKNTISDITCNLNIFGLFNFFVKISDKHWLKIALGR